MQGHAQTVHQAARHQPGATDACAAMNGDCLARKQVIVELIDEAQQLAWRARRPAIRDREGAEVDPLLGAERRLVLQLQLSNLRRLQQGHDHVDPGKTPARDFGPKVRAATRTRHEAKAMRLDAGNPVDGCFEH
jgi:hypothetical protein